MEPTKDPNYITLLGREAREEFKTKLGSDEWWDGYGWCLLNKHDPGPTGGGFVPGDWYRRKLDNTWTRVDDRPPTSKDATFNPPNNAVGVVLIGYPNGYIMTMAYHDVVSEAKQYPGLRWARFTPPVLPPPQEAWEIAYYKAVKIHAQIPRSAKLSKESFKAGWDAKS